MSKARLVITAISIEKRPVSEVARTYGVARSWIYTLLARYRDEGEAAFEPRSRRPRTSPSAVSADAAELIVRLRKELAGQGLDAGPHTIAWHLREHHQVTVSPATISRHLARAGLVVPAPAKRPRSSYVRFAAEQPNECWQSDFTHYPLADGTDAEVLTWLDDHSRYVLSLTAHRAVTGEAALAAFRAACARYGPPASTLTDNGTVSIHTAGHPRHIGIGRAHAGAPVLIRTSGPDITIISAATGEILRQLTLDPARNYQPTGKPRRPRRKHPDPMWVHSVLDVLRDHSGAGDRNRTRTISLGICAVRALMSSDLRGGLSMSDGERPFVTGVNGPLPVTPQRPHSSHHAAHAC